MNSSTENFLKMIKHPVKFRVFLFWKLPAAFFSGVRIKEIDENKCTVSVPYKWLTQNPFRSTYFASLAMAAEMSTGALVMMYVYKRKPPISMLITNMEASYFKKATGKIYFVCDAGKQIQDAIEEAILSNEPKSITVRSTGNNKSGELIAAFLFTWSFRIKKT
jgi:hypothetical protein